MKSDLKSGERSWTKADVFKYIKCFEERFTNSVVIRIRDARIWMGYSQFFQGLIERFWGIYRSSVGMKSQRSSRLPLSECGFDGPVNELSTWLHWNIVNNYLSWKQIQDSTDIVFETVAFDLGHVTRPKRFGSDTSNCWHTWFANLFSPCSYSFFASERTLNHPLLCIISATVFGAIWYPISFRIDEIFLAPYVWRLSSKIFSIKGVYSLRFLEYGVSLTSIARY